MTTKDIEIASGMSRANIRFYEAEGLLKPERRANGYREYSEDDLEILKKVKLLRTLHISLEEIKSLNTGERALVDTLNQHLTKLQSEKSDIERSTRQPVPTPLSDIIPEARIPWHRFFARLLDYTVYSTLWNIFLALVLNINIRERSIGGNVLDEIVILIAMFFLEPLLLSLFGTTPGKWILGIRVTDNEGELMTYSNARARTRTMLIHGIGLGIPIYSLVRLWKSYKAVNNGETLDWEYHSAITLKDEKSWRIFTYLGINAALIGVLALTLAMAAMPRNRGDITVAEFCENYNTLAEYYGFAADSYLDAQGNRVQEESPENVVYIIRHDYPTFILEERDGFMTGMQFTVNKQNDNAMISGYSEEIALSILAFVGAQKENSLFSNKLEEIVLNISGYPFNSYQCSVYGVNITYDVEYSGYYDTTLGILWPLEDTDLSCSFSFSMQKEEGM